MFLDSGPSTFNKLQVVRLLYIIIAIDCYKYWVIQSHNHRDHCSAVGISIPRVKDMLYQDHKELQ
jgi:hypothetical protein